MFIKRAWEMLLEVSGPIPSDFFISVVPNMNRQCCQSTLGQFQQISLVNPQPKLMEHTPGGPANVGIEGTVQQNGNVGPRPANMGMSSKYGN